MSNLNLEPFELSLWKDTLITDIVENQEGYANIYQGLGTDEKNLEFWYLPRNWDGVNFLQKNNSDGTINLNSIKIDISSPQQRKENTVLADFSTSTLNFKPNSYYTFLMKLDFSKGELPDWIKHKAYYPSMTSCPLITLVHKSQEDNSLNMPKSIFDSSLIISYGADGFSLEGTEFNNKYENGTLFTFNSNSGSDENNEVKQLIVLGCLKTNDFLKNNITLGMWSFLEAWEDDYWNADMELYVFEDKIISEENDGVEIKKPDLYSSLYYDLSGEEAPGEVIDEVDLEDKAFNQFKEYFPIKENNNEEPILKDCPFYKIKENIDEIIRNYYLDLKLYIDDFLLQNTGSDFYKKLSEDNYFNENYLPQDENILSKTIYTLSQSAAQIFYNHFSGLIFPCKDEKDTIIYFNSLNSYTTQYQNIIKNNFFNQLETFLDNNSLKEAFCLDSTILLPVIFSDDNSGLYFKGDITKTVREKIDDNFIESQINLYWDKFFKNINNNSINIIDYYIENVYKSQDSILYNFVIENNEIRKEGVELVERFGVLLSYLPFFSQVYSSFNRKYIEYGNIKLIQGLVRLEESIKNSIIPFIFGLYTAKIYDINNTVLFEIEDTFSRDFRNFKFYPNLTISSLSVKLNNGTKDIHKLSFYNTYNNYKDNFPQLSSLEFKKFLYNIDLLKRKEDINVNIINNYNNLDIFKKQENKAYLKEEKVLTFGMLDGPNSFAQDVVLTESTKDAINTLTFSLYNNYYNDFGQKEKNPFIDLIQEEDKIKLKYKNKWYDFIITDSNLDSIANKWDYTAKDANVIELSKIGFNKTFNTELDNNVGTIDELAQTTLIGTDWQLGKNDKFYQDSLKPVIGGIIRENLTIRLQPFYYDENLNKINEEINITISSGDFVYLFYNNDKNNTDSTELIFKIIYLKTGEESYTSINNILNNVYLYPNFTVYFNGQEYKPQLKEYVINPNNIVVLIPDIFEENTIEFDYSLRAKDLVIKPITHYSVPLKRYVTEYIDTSDNNNIEPKILYGYAESKYSTKPLVQNLLPNGEDFTSLDGWINGAVNNNFKIETGLNAAIRNKDINTITPYLTFSTEVESGGNRQPHGFICNTDLSYNFSNIDHLTPGEKMVLRVQIERGNNFIPVNSSNNYSIDDQLTIMETMHPYLYFYNNSMSLQSKNDTTILPSKEKLVMNFIQEKRFQDVEKLKAKLKDGETFFSNGYSRFCYNYNSQDVSPFLDLGIYKNISKNEQRLNEEGLVSIHWCDANKITQSYNAQYVKDHISNVNNIPFAYIPKKVAEDWCDKGYLYSFSDIKILQSRVGNSKSYCLSYKGAIELKKLFTYGISPDKPVSAFKLRDFSIIAYTGDLKTHIENGTSYIPGATSEIIYYLPMLFSDTDLLKEMEEIEKTTETPDDDFESNFKNNKNYFYTNFFKYKHWQEVLETKEHYIIQPTSQSDKKISVAFPQNINIDFGDEENNISWVADSTGYNDFDLIMRMRSFWYLKKYSRTGTCIFETEGTFYGKPILDDNGRYTYKTNKIGPVGYSHEDLLNQHLGLFLTFDQTRYDDGAKGNASVAISKIELFRKYIDENDELILPNKILESNTTPIYRLYDPNKNKNVINADDIEYEYIDVKLDSKYEPNIDLTGERKNSITITESNCYNILQKLAEIFDGWLVIDVEHDPVTGAILLNKENKPIKKVRFINSKYNENFAGIKYGINLNKIQRKVDSNDVITKLIVKNNNNEFGKNKFCSIARSKYNLNGTNAIFQLDYLVNTNKIPQEIKNKLFNEIYPRTYAYGQFLADLIEQRSQQLIIMSQAEAAMNYNKLVIEDAQEKLSDYLGRYDSLNIKVNKRKVGIGYFIANEQARNTYSNQNVKTIVNTVIFYNSLIEGYSSKYYNSIEEYNKASDKYNKLNEITSSITIQRDSLINDFQSLCGNRIKEGAWSSEDYIDDDLYYLDAERQAKEYSEPRVTYTIDIVDISSLPDWKAYTFNLRDKTFIEDPEIFGYDEHNKPIQEEIIITEKSSHLQSPDKNTITVQNYKTQFSDLFQRIASTIQAVEFGTLNYSNKNSADSLEIKVANNEASLQALRQYNGI